MTDAGTASPTVEDLRAQADDAVARGDALAAETALRSLWRMSPGHATAPFVAGRFERLRPALRLRACRIWIARSFTVEPLVPLLRAAGFASRLDLEVRVGEFNAYAQELLDPRSPLYEFAPDVVLLTVQARDVAPDVWEGFADLDGSAVEATTDRVTRLYRELVDAFHLTGSHLVLHTLELPPSPAYGPILDAQRPGQTTVLRRINEELAELARVVPHVALLDYDAIVARRGRDRWFDRRKWLTSRMPIPASEQVHLVDEWVRLLHPLLGRTCKAVAVDLDNTLWGGVVGEDGVDNIALDGEYPGAAYRDLQRALLDLHQRGVMLAVCSKNNEADALDALEHHPGMLLRPQHFASTRINWTDKATNLVEIARELNIGVDALAFLDDNPVEREFVRRQLPEVTVIELPADPLDYAETVRRAPVFERLNLTAEDRERGRYYAEQKRRREFESTAASVEDFLWSLALEVEVEPVTAATLARAAQLTQKTNQFNLTTRRYTEQEVATMASAPSTGVYTLRAADRFGDNGIVGVAILRLGERVGELDTFLLSCRVIGRTIETAFLSVLVDEARSAGKRRLRGEFVPTAKNAPARDFYPSHGFVEVPGDNGAGVWELDLEAGGVAAPPWIRLRAPTATSTAA